LFPQYVSRVFLDFPSVNRPVFSVFTPCFRLSFRTAETSFLSPLYIRFSPIATSCALVALPSYFSFRRFCPSLNQNISPVTAQPLAFPIFVS
jgi:hypothetical protein